MKLVAALLGLRRAIGCPREKGELAGLGNLGFFPSLLKKDVTLKAGVVSATASNLEEPFSNHVSDSSEHSDWEEEEGLELPANAVSSLTLDASLLQTNLAALKSSLTALPPLPYFLFPASVGRGRKGPQKLAAHEEAELLKYTLAMLPHYLVHATVDDLQFLIDLHPAFRKTRLDETEEAIGSLSISSSKGSKRIFQSVKKQLAELRTLLNLAPNSRAPELPSDFNFPPFALALLSNGPDSSRLAPHNTLSIAIFSFLAQLHLHSQLWHTNTEEEEGVGLPSTLGPVITLPFHFREKIGRLEKSYSADVAYPDWLPCFPLLLQRVAQDLLEWSFSRYPGTAGVRTDLDHLAGRIANDWLLKPKLTLDLTTPFHLSHGIIEQDPESEVDAEPGPAVFLKAKVPTVNNLPGPLKSFLPLIRVGPQLLLSSEERTLLPTRQPGSSSKNRGNVPTLTSLAAKVIAASLPRLAVQGFYADPPARFVEVAVLLELCPPHLKALISGNPNVVETW